MEAALSFEELTTQACEAGDYVCGYIRSYVVSTFGSGKDAYAAAFLAGIGMAFASRYVDIKIPEVSLAAPFAV